MNILFLDTETTGLLKPQGTQLDLQPRVVEIAAAIFDIDGNHQTSFRELINPDRPMPIEATRINGITDLKLRLKPKFAEIYRPFETICRNADIVVAHNMYFDKAMIQLELDNLAYSNSFSPHPLENPLPEIQICTIESTEHLMGYRLSLIRLYQYLFNRRPAQSHRAFSDIMALKDCFFELRKRKVLYI